MKRCNENIGITLIALVVTIVVLLILSGISINMLTGQNGILNRTREAKERTLTSQQEEQNIIKSYEDQMSNYVGIDWENVKANAKAPDEQKEERNNGVIGIGTDGKTVNMDLWEYKKIENGYALSCEGSLDASNKVAGYKGKIENGKIETCIPMYIKDTQNGDQNFTEVVSLRDTFFGVEDMKYPPIIPYTVDSLFETFQGCVSLEKMPIIPQNVTDMTSTFYNCQSLKELSDISDNVLKLDYCFYNNAITNVNISLGKKVTTMKETFSGCKQLENFYSELPENVANLQQTFAHCEKLVKAPNIPYGVKSMCATFQYCYLLESPPKEIPETVENLQWAFQNCYILNGKIEINGCKGNILSNGNYDYAGIFVGACTNSQLTLTRNKSDAILNDILKDANNSNITTL